VLELGQSSLEGPPPVLAQRGPRSADTSPPGVLGLMTSALRSRRIATEAVVVLRRYRGGLAIRAPSGSPARVLLAPCRQDRVAAQVFGRSRPGRKCRTSGPSPGQEIFLCFLAHREGMRLGHSQPQL